MKKAPCLIVFAVVVLICVTISIVKTVTPISSDENTYCVEGYCTDVGTQSLPGIITKHNTMFVIVELDNGETYETYVPVLRREGMTVTELSNKISGKYVKIYVSFYEDNKISRLSFDGEDIISYASTNRNLRLNKLGIWVGFICIIALSAVYTFIKCWEIDTERKKKETPEKYLYGKELEEYTKRRRQNQKQKRKQSMQKKSRKRNNRK